MVYDSKSYVDDIRLVSQMFTELSNLSGMSILITGVTGLINSCVTDILLYRNILNKNKLGLNMKLFLAGRDRKQISERFTPFKENEDYTFTFFDATTGIAPKTNERIDYIIHGASNAHPAVFSKQPVETMLTNLLGTNALLKMAAENNAKRFLYISSSEVYGKNESIEPYSETDFGYLDILNPRACYPSSKRAAETLCAAYSSEYGVDYVTVRPGHIYGPTMTDSDSRASAQFARNAVSGEDIVMKSAGTQLRSYCYVTDCATAILTVLLKGKCGEAYNISNPKSRCTVRELAEAFQNVRGGGRLSIPRLQTRSLAATI